MTIWVPQHMTFAEEKKILDDDYRKIGIDPAKVPIMPTKEFVEEFYQKMAAWEKDHPNEPWGPERVKAEDRKRGERLAAEKAAKSKE